MEPIIVSRLTFALMRGWHTMGAYRDFSRKVIQRDKLISMWDRLRLAGSGFYAYSERLYDLARNDKNDYLSDLQRLITRRINWPYDMVLDNKLLFDRVYSSLLRVSTVLGMLSRGRVFTLDARHNLESIADLIDYIAEGQACVVKPVADGGGQGIHVVRKGEHSVLLNDVAIEPRALAEKLSTLSNYIACDFVAQGAYASRLYPHTTNTLRVLTMVDPESSEPFVAAAVQRIGTEKSRPTDNWTQGGISASVDLDAGQLGNAVGFTRDRHIAWTSNHPDTGEQVEGVAVPNWPDLVKQLLAAARSTPFIKYIGWDVVVQDDGFVVLEGNNYSDVHVIQVHRPLLRDERVRNFYRHYGIVK